MDEKFAEEYYLLLWLPPEAHKLLQVMKQLLQSLINKISTQFRFTILN